MKRLLLLGCLITAFAAADERPKAGEGFHWTAYEGLYCEIQVPTGWSDDHPAAGITRVVRISPTPIQPGQTLGTGFTMNAVKCANQRQWLEAVELAGKMMAETRVAMQHPIQSTVKPEKDMLLMILEGERFIPTAPHPEKKYHIRAIVRAFPQFGLVYMYSFGAPISEWDEAWKKGNVMLNPIWFHLKE